MSEVFAESCMSEARLCCKCHAELKEVMNGFDIMAPKVVYCNSANCDRFGLVTMTWASRNADGTIAGSTSNKVKFEVI